MAFYTTRQPLPQDHPIISRCPRASLSARVSKYPIDTACPLALLYFAQMVPFPVPDRDLPVRSELRFTNKWNITSVESSYREIEQSGEGADAVQRQPGPMSKGVSGVINFITTGAHVSIQVAHTSKFEIRRVAPKLGDTNHQRFHPSSTSSAIIQARLHQHNSLESH